MKTSLHRIVLGYACATGVFLASAAVIPTNAYSDEQVGIDAFAATDEPPAFNDPAKAVEAFKQALAADELDEFATLLGLDAAKLKSDENTMATFEQIRAGAAQRLTVEDIGDRKLLQIGSKLWELPFPLVKVEGGKWAFDTYAGLEEIVNRRVGENELQAIATVRAYGDAQDDYASEDRDGDGVLEYAQKLISSEGLTDGLYWPAEQGSGDSPAGALVDQAELADANKGEGYFGYRFRILKGQGDQIAGGSYDYVINGNMIAGHALIAWPVKYGETGVHTFAVNQSGIVYEADLGAATDQIVKYIERFNPDSSWSVTDD
jgi:Protein of unknown function (DUF2950)